MAKTELVKIGIYQKQNFAKTKFFVKSSTPRFRPDQRHPTPPGLTGIVLDAERLYHPDPICPVSFVIYEKNYLKKKYVHNENVI